MKASGNQGQSITDINITPLVDVMLVLLIIFMATAPLIHRRAINVNVPKVAHNERKATETLNLVMNEKREIFLGEQKVASIDELKSQLEMLVRADPLVHIAILADQAIPYGEVVNLLDVARGAGAKKVALEVKSKKSE